MKKVVQISQILILAGIISFLFSLNLRGLTYQDSCFRLIWEHNPEKEFENPDSVMYDSCKCGMNIFEFADSNRRWPREFFYADKWFWVNLPNGSLDVLQAPSDTTIIRHWTDISSSFTTLRNDFENLENTYGNFVLRKLYPEDIDTLTSFKVWLIKLDNYVNIDSVETFLKNFEDYKFPYPYPPFYRERFAIYYISVANSLQINKSFVIYPNPASDYIEIKIGNKLSESFELSESYQIQIYNVYGEQMPVGAGSEPAPTGINRIDISHFPTGMYFIRIGDEIGKFVKY